MPKTYAKVNLSIWQDPEFRQLPQGAQHLYLLLWTHTTLSYCGVAEWKPKRLQALTEGLTAADVEDAARCLEARLFIVTSPDTDEVLLRSWVRYDGLLKEWRMGIAFAKAYVNVASRDIQRVIVHEGLRLQQRQPELAAWTEPRSAAQVLEVLANDALDPRDRDLPVDPFALGLADVSATFGPKAVQGQGDVRHPPTTTTSTSTDSLSTSEIAAAKSEAPRDDVERLCQHLADRIEGNGSKRPEITKRWRDAARLLLDKDGRAEAPVHVAIDWCQDHEFWKANILSMSKLREKYDQLRLTAQRGTGSAKPLAAPDPLHARLERELAARKQAQQ